MTDMSHSIIPVGVAREYAERDYKAGMPIEEAPMAWLPVYREVYEELAAKQQERVA